VLVADDLPSSVATIVSRCVQIPFDAISPTVMTAWLVDHGVDLALAESVAAASGGRLDRARLLVNDAGFAARQQQWRSVPARLDGTGAAAATVAFELLASADDALAPLREQHTQEIAALVEQAEANGSKGVPGRKQMEDRHKREERRWRTDDLRFGLATLAEVYRDRLVGTVGAADGPGSPGSATERRRAAREVDAITEASTALGRNANESLLMDALMVELSAMLD